MKRMISIVFALGMIASLLAYFLLAEMPICYTANGANSFAAKLYGAGVDEASMRKVWHAGWIAAICAPWIAISSFVVSRWIRRNNKLLNRLPIFSAICGVLTLLSLPDPVLTTLPGLDNSWQWLLSHFAFNRVFGSKTIFTYGPLGFLICPLFLMISIDLGVSVNSIKTISSYRLPHWLLRGWDIFVIATSSRRLNTQRMVFLRYVDGAREIILMLKQ